MLTRQLRARFGALDAATETRILSAPTQELEQWLERVLTAESLDDVFTS
jgi:hypothetical protein